MSASPSSSAPVRTSRRASCRRCSTATASQSVRTSGPPPGAVPVHGQPDGRDARRRCATTKRKRRCASSRATANRSAAGWSCRCRSSSTRSRRGIGYRFRDRGLLEHALTHKSKAHEDPSGGVIDNESLEFLGDAVLGLVIADALFRSFPTYNEGQKSKIKAIAGLDGVAGRAGRAARPRRAHDPRPRRREDRRPPQAGAAGRHLRGADRRDLSRRRPRAGARSS